MVYARFPEVYVHFTLMYTTDHIFPVLSIKYLINEDGDPTTPYKLATGTKPLVSHLRVLFCPCVVRKAMAHVETKTLNMHHQAQKRVSQYLRWGSRSEPHPQWLVGFENNLSRCRYAAYLDGFQRGISNSQSSFNVSGTGTSRDERTSWSDLENVAYSCARPYGTC